MPQIIESPKICNKQVAAYFVGKYVRVFPIILCAIYRFIGADSDIEIFFSLQIFCRIAVGINFFRYVDF